MPTLPILDSAKLNTGQTRSRVSANANAFGALEARGAQDVAGGLADVAKSVEHINARLDEADANSLDVAYTQFERDQLHNPEHGYFGKQGKNALDERPLLEQRLNGKIDEIAKSARSERAKQAFIDLARKRKMDSMTRADAYAQDQFRAYEVETFKARADEAKENLVAGFLDKDARTRNEATLLSIMDGIAQRQGMSPEAAAHARKEIRADAYYDAIALQIGNNPYETKKQLTGKGGWGEALGAEQKARLLTAVENEIDRRRAKWESSVRDAVSNQMDLMEMGVPVKPGDRVSLDTVRSALGEGAAAKYELSMTVYDRQQAMLTAPGADLAGIIARPAVVPKGKEDVRAVMLDRAEKVAAAQVLERRAKDPMAYLIDNGIVDPTPSGMGARGGRSPADAFTAIKNGDWDSLGAVLRWRKSSLETSGAKLGVRSMPLTGQEAAALGGALSILPPDQQSKALARMSAALGDGEVYRGLMQQVAGASSGSTGYAGVLVAQKRSLAGMTGDQAAQTLLTGQSLLSGGDAEGKGKKFAMPGEQDMRKAFVGYTGGKSANSPSALPPNAEAGAYDAFRAAYAGLAAEKGITDGKIDGGLAERAAAIATGGVQTVYGRKTVMPWGMSGKTFTSILARDWDAITAGYPSLKGTKPQDYDYVVGKDGKYHLLQGDAPVVEADGREVIISMKTRKP